MTSDTGDILREKLARLEADIEAEQKAKAGREAEKHLQRLVVRRNLCWIAAGVTFLSAAFLSIGHWSGAAPVPSGVISWLGPGLTTFAILGGLAAQISINHARTIAEVRDARPADAEAIGQMVAELQANRELIRQMRNDLATEVPRLVAEAVARAREDDRAEIKKMMDEALKKAHASGYVAGVQQRLNGSGGMVVPLQKT